MLSGKTDIHGDENVADQEHVAVFSQGIGELSID
jgi:hypothetical protein